MTNFGTSHNRLVSRPDKRVILTALNTMLTVTPVLRYKKKIIVSNYNGTGKTTKNNVGVCCLQRFSKLDVGELSIHSNFMHLFNICNRLSHKAESAGHLISLNLKF